MCNEYADNLIQDSDFMVESLFSNLRNIKFWHCVIVVSRLKSRPDEINVVETSNYLKKKK